MTENKKNQSRWPLPLRWFLGGKARARPTKTDEHTVDDVESSALLTETKQLHADYSSTAIESDHTAGASSDTSEERSLQKCLSNTWEGYYSLLENNPLLVKSVTAFFILGLADMCAQGIEHLRGTSSLHGAVDWPRTARFGAFGLFGAPFSHYYFFYLDHYLKPTTEPFTKTTLLKVFIDQFIQAPILLAFMICALSLMKGEGIDGMKKDMSSNYWTSLLANWKLWLPASLINLAFVKPELRVLYVNVVFFFWTIVLSIILNSPE